MRKRTRVLVLLTIVLPLLIVVSMVVYNTLRNEAPMIAIKPPAEFKLEQARFDAAVQRLSQAIQIKTVSQLSAEQFDPHAREFMDFLQKHYPLLHEKLQLTVINKHSLIYHWPSADKSTDHKRSKPILFLAHYDVVPANETSWQHPPFSGDIDANAIWGRGSLDDKSSLLAMLEAVSYMLERNIRPKRDVYFAFGHDEEIGGEQGAAAISQYFERQSIDFDMALDEGLVVTHGVIDFVAQPVALIGVSEKGLLDVELVLDAQGGHASMPGRYSAAGKMAQALVRIEASPMASRLTFPIATMLQTLAPHSKGLSRAALSNQWLFKPIILQKLNAKLSTHAAVNTTIVTTQLMASNKINVLPEKVVARINIRILPGDSVDSVLAHLKRVIDDPAIEMTVLNRAYEPAPYSHIDNAEYQQLQATIRQIYPQALVAPGLVLAATDSRHYRRQVKNIYRFMPLSLQKQDLSRIHGQNERILISDYKLAIRFYYQLLINLATG